MKELFIDSYVQSPLLWGLAEDILAAGSRGTAVGDGIYDAELLPTIPIALDRGAWLLRSGFVR